MKKLGIIRILVAFFLIQGASPVDADNAAIRLQLKLQEGDSYYMEMVTEATPGPTPPLGDAPRLPGPGKLKTEMAYEVQEVDSKGNMTIKATYLSFLYDQEYSHGTWPGTIEPTTRAIYDSTNPPATDDPIPIEVIGEAASVGKSTTMMIAPNNTVIKVIKNVKEAERFRARVEEIIDNIPRADDETKARLKKGFPSTATNESTKKPYPWSLGLYKQIYPDHPVKVGDTWKVQYPDFEDHHFTLRDLRNGIAFIEEKTVFRDKEGKTWDKREGVVEIDVKTGWIQKMDFHSEHDYTLRGQTYLHSKSKFHMGPIAGR